MTPPPTPDPSPTHGMALVGIDWGTTHRRCYRLGARGALQAEQADDQGLLAANARPASSSRSTKPTRQP